MAIPANIGVRKAKRALADIRAVEEQGERTNPIGHTGATPSAGVSQVRGGIGRGAIPSMGVSQFRGGKKHTLVDHIEHPMKGFGKEEESESDEETPMEAGRMLRSHIEELHGGRYVHHFMKGFGMSGGMNTGATEGEGKFRGGSAPDARMVGGISSGPGFYEASGKKPKRAMAADDPRRKRGAAISKLIKEKGMSLGEASRHIKEHPELLK